MSKSLLRDTKFVFFGDVFRLSVLLAPNAITGFAGGVLEHREHHVLAAQFNLAPSEGECLADLEFGHCAVRQRASVSPK